MMKYNNDIIITIYKLHISEVRKISKMQIRSVEEFKSKFKRNQKTREIVSHNSKVINNSTTYV